MFEFHKDKERYFNIQRTVTAENIIPFIEQNHGLCRGKKVLEIGGAEAGVLKAFLDIGNTGVGVELSSSRFDTAISFLSIDIQEGRARIVNKNIYDIADPAAEFGFLFDIIILKDVIEHIPDQDRFIPKLKDFLSDDGVIFFAYPPWWMPFGGHQQICSHKLLRTLPWFHLLPLPLYKAILSAFGEKDATIAELLDIRSTGINIERLYTILRTHQYKIISQIFWFTNPIYQFKFGVKKRQLPSILASLPYIRNFYTTAHYILFRK
ncbi:MAG: methyltransferase domain-containing protein [Saprospiraceae bacterium]|nr:methyltransferase domain-containing protein [Saprospiraceae bacterium]